ncbi:MAG: efflux RND transporter periplasmic adaptor subunit, partial [Gammaproteobacteria bacterium]|nr:efflux RND transporter periplasmic adaptor subunit [Gammaproteobacteria bacterium]
MRKRIIVTLAGVLMMCALPVWAAELAATLHWYRRVELGTPVSGVIAAVPVRPGDRVKRGQPLVRLDARAFQAEVDKAGAVLYQRTQDRAEAKRALDRAQTLYAQTVLSTHELDLAKLGFATAAARYREARANLALARLDLEHSVVRAPYDGVVLSRAAQVGQTVVSRL